jgi:hypothetical protein
MGQEAETALINVITLAVEVGFVEYMNCEAQRRLLPARTLA